MVHGLRPSRVVVLAIAALVLLGGCASTAVTASSPTISASVGLTTKQWNDGPLSAYTSSMNGLGNSWYGTSAGCSKARRVVQSALAADAPADPAIASAWHDTLLAKLGVVDACMDSNHDAALAATDNYADGLKRTLAAVSASKL